MSIIGTYIILLAVILINIYIIRNEYKYKKIPNKLLSILLIFNLIYFFISPNPIFLLPTLIKLSFLIIWTFALYYFKIWTPSYLKYIFVSSIFFLWNLEITFFSNIFFIILLYIILYFFYFYAKLLLEPKILKTHIVAAKENIKWIFNDWGKKNSNNTVLKIITIILWFLAVFIIIRSIRYYLKWELSFINNIITIDNITINTFIIVLIIIIAFTWTMHKLYHKYLLDNYKYLLIIITGTTWFIIYELIYDYEFVSTFLHRILLFLLSLFLIARIIIYMWKYLFFDTDSKVINYKKLKTWDIIDITFLSSFLIWQKSLKNDNIDVFLKKIQNPINNEDCKKLKKLIKKNSDYQKKQWKVLPPNVIKIYNIFIFSPFIFWSFLITLFIWQNLLINLIIYIFKLISMR